MDEHLPLEQPVATGDKAGVQDAQVEVVEIDLDNVDVTLRFLLGLLALGGTELAQRLQEMQQEIEAGRGKDESPRSVWSTARRHRLRYFSIAVLMRGQKGIRNGARRSFRASVSATRRALATGYRLTDNRLTRPVRRPLEARLMGMLESTAHLVREGQQVTKEGRVLATGTTADLILDIMDEVSSNPELLSFVQGLLGQQGKGLATVVVDNSRSVSLTADDATEGLLRWVLRRTPRRSLPPSPVEGEPQNMYAPQAGVEGGTNHET